jgi:hypothetical protein
MKAIWSQIKKDKEWRNSFSSKRKRQQQTKKKGSSVRTVSGGLPSLGKRR